MQIIKSLAEWQALRKNLRHSLGFVPTMGNLHPGHASLLQASARENECTLLSIFINPTQFNNQDDFQNYPQTLAQDLALAEESKADYVLLPTYEELYPDNYHYQISELELSQTLEGAFRPGHFTGMLTVVLKLSNLAEAQRAYFGEKDYQQLQLIRGLSQAFFIKTQIIGCPIIRNEFGLALSSRNNRLTPEQWRQAPYFPAIFHSKQSCAEISAQLEEKGFKVDYVEEGQGRRLAAVWLGDIRLIDNISA